MAVTVRDIANLAGVSVATVSRVTNDAGNVSAETRERVLSAITRLQYSPNAYAAQLARRSSGISRNGKESKGDLPAQPRRRSSIPRESSERRGRMDQLRLLERENLQLRRQVSSLLTDLEKWKESLKRQLGT